ncbi:MAG: hypothetical protein J7485_14620 [Sphingobium sp.]|nr:hypothetical protein [Sphingobium sp.]
MTHLPDMTAFDRAPGYAVQYHSGVVNHCPGCAGTQWLIGRTTAQCARCETALPLAQHGEWVHQPMFVSRVSSTAHPA